MSRKSIVLRLPASTVADLKEFDEEAQLLLLTTGLTLAKRPAQELVKEDEDTDPRSIISKSSKPSTTITTMTILTAMMNRQKPVRMNNVR